MNKAKNELLTIDPKILDGALVTLGDYYGSISAARLLGKHGVPIYFADHRRLVSGKFSRYVTKRLLSPPVNLVSSFYEWLLYFGRNNHGFMLYPTSDDLAWIIASRRDELSKYYKLYQPSIDSIYQLLNKERLFKIAQRLGVKAPRTLFPKDLSRFEKDVESMRYPCLIKPRTQMCFESKQKGKHCETYENLKKDYPAFMQKFIYHEDIIKYDPDVVWPMVQEYHPEAMEHTYSIAGFITEDGQNFSMRASQKVLQRPRRLGIGVCFEGRPVRPDIRDHILSICRSTGYFGAFEAEFIQIKDNFLLIDFNPRYYSQMAFEEARGLPLSLLTYLGAHGKVAEMNEILSRKDLDQGREHLNIYSHHFLLVLLLTTQWLGGRMTFQERRHWLLWKDKQKKNYTDAVADPEDFWPFFIDLIMHIKNFIRHPRDFLRKYFGRA